MFAGCHSAIDIIFALSETLKRRVYIDIPAGLMIATMQEPNKIKSLQYNSCRGSLLNEIELIAVTGTAPITI